MHVKTDKPPSSRMKRTNGNGQVHLPGPGHPAKAPDIRPLERLPLQLLRHQVPTGPGHPAPQARTSGPSRGPGYSAPCLEIRTPPNPRATWPASPAWTSGPPRTPGHPASLSANSKGPRPMYPFYHPRLYILYPVQLSRVSIGLAHTQR